MPNPVDWVDRLEMLITLKGGGKQNAFCEWIGEKPSRVNNYLKRTTENPASDFVQALVEQGVNANWFLTGRGEMYITEDSGAALQPAVQTLIHELQGWEELAPTLTEMLRHAKEANRIQYLKEEKLDEFKLQVNELKKKFGQTKKHD